MQLKRNVLPVYLWKNFFFFFFRFVDGECGSSSGDSTGQLELSGGEQPDESSPASIHETNNNSLLHEDLERRI